MVIDSFKPNKILKSANLKKRSFHRKNAMALSEIVIFAINSLIEDKEVISLDSPISMRKFKSHATSWINSYIKAKKKDKVARFIGYYKNMPTIIIQTLKNEGIMTQTEEGVNISWSHLEQLSEKTDHFKNQGYFVPYFK